MGLLVVVREVQTLFGERCQTRRDELAAELTDEVVALLLRAASGFGLEVDPDVPLPVVDTSEPS